MGRGLKFFGSFKHREPDKTQYEYQREGMHRRIEIMPPSLKSEPKEEFFSGYEYFYMSFMSDQEIKITPKFAEALQKEKPVGMGNN